MTYWYTIGWDGYGDESDKEYFGAKKSYELMIECIVDGLNAYKGRKAFLVCASEDDKDITKEVKKELGL